MPHFQVDDGMHFLRNRNASATFGVSVFGSDSSVLECSYGMPGAADFSRVDVSVFK